MRSLLAVVRVFAHVCLFAFLVAKVCVVECVVVWVMLWLLLLMFLLFLGGGVRCRGCS